VYPFAFEGIKLIDVQTSQIDESVIAVPENPEGGSGFPSTSNPFVISSNSEGP